jgi:hypothetical protein
LVVVDRFRPGGYRFLCRAEKSVQFFPYLIAQRHCTFTQTIYLWSLILLSMQILEAREELLQSLQARNKQGSKVPGGATENVNLSSPPTEEKVIEASSIQDKAGTSEVSSFKEPTSDITSDIESERFSISTTDVEIIDKSVIQEEPAVKNEVKTWSVESKSQFGTDEVDEWPDDDGPAEEVGAACNNNRTSLGREEDVSFSDLNKRDDGQQGK